MFFLSYLAFLLMLFSDINISFSKWHLHCWFDFLDVALVCRCSSHLDLHLLLFMVQLVLLFSRDILCMTPTTWSSASHMMSTFGLQSLCIWIFLTCFLPFCGCWGKGTINLLPIDFTLTILVFWTENTNSLKTKTRDIVVDSFYISLYLNVAAR